MAHVTYSVSLSCAGKYKTQLYDNMRGEWMPSSPGIGMHVEVSTPLIRDHYTITHYIS